MPFPASPLCLFESKAPLVFERDRADDFLRRGVFSCYRPIDDAAALPENQKELGMEDWRRLL